MFTTNSTAVRYCRTVREQCPGLYAVWPPNSRLELGDIGYLLDGVFFRKTNLMHVPHFPSETLPWKIRRGTARSHYAITSGGGSELTFLARGAAGPFGRPLAKAQAKVVFSSAGSVFFNAAGCVINEIEDQISLGRIILKLFALGIWSDDWCVVTRIVMAASTTAAIASQRSAAIRFEAVGKNDHIDLADASTKMVATSSVGVTNMVVTTGGGTPLIGLSRVRERLFGSPVFGATELDPQDSYVIRERLLKSGSELDEVFEFIECE